MQKYWFIVGLVLSYVLVEGVAQAASLTFISDTIETSWPGVGTNHTIQFTITTEVMGGKIVITPQTTQFGIPLSLSYKDIDVIINGIQRPLNVTPGPQSLFNGSLVYQIGITTISGTTGNIMMTLHPDDVIPRGAVVLIKIGRHSIVGAMGSWHIRNPFTKGSYRINIETTQANNEIIDRGTAMIAVLPSVGVFGSVGGASLEFADNRDEFIDPSVSGTLIFDHNLPGMLSIEFPKDFVAFGNDSHAVNFHIEVLEKTVFKQSSREARFLQNNDEIIGAMYNIKLQNDDFTNITSTTAKPIDIDFFYTDADIQGLNELTLKARHFNGASWDSVPNVTVVPDENRVRAPATSFSFYGITGNFICADGIDNDVDGRIDYPNDPGCASAQSGDESGSATRASTVPYRSSGSIDVAPQRQAQEQLKEERLKEEQPKVSVKPITKKVTSAIFKTDLFRGMRNDDVRRLQELLAQDKRIYPEGLVTGFFGPMTVRAVERFQLQHKVIARSGASGAGRVGPKTRVKLNEVFHEKELFVEPPAIELPTQEKVALLNTLLLLLKKLQGLLFGGQ